MPGGYLQLVAIIGLYTALVLWPPRRPRALAVSVFPNSEIDAKRVISWVRSHAAGYGADPRVLIVAGSSAGAHLGVDGGADPQ